MFNFDALAQWWNLQMKEAKKPYWVLHRGAGGKAGQTIATFGTEDVDASWTALVETIANAGSQGVYEFIIVVRPGGVNDTNGKREFQLRSSALNGQNQQMQQPGIYGIQPYQAPPVDVALITQQITDKLKAEHQLELMKFKHDAQMEKMEEMIAGIADAKKSNFDRFLEVLENPDVAKGFIGLVQHLKSTLIPMPAMAANIGHVPGAKPRPAPKVYEMPAEPDTEGETDHPDEAQGPPIYEELAVEYDCAIEAVNLLAEAHYEAPGELLQKVARWAVANPAMAKNLIGSL